MRSANGQLGENERQWKKNSEQEHKQQKFLWAQFLWLQVLTRYVFLLSYGLFIWSEPARLAGLALCMFIWEGGLAIFPKPRLPEPRYPQPGPARLLI